MIPKFEELSIGLRLLDIEDSDEVEVMRMDDIHNVLLVSNRTRALVCFDESCDEYTGSLYEKMGDTK